MSLSAKNKTEEELLLELLLKDPKLLKSIEKLSSDNNVKVIRDKKERRLKDLGNPTHVNEIEQLCKLCGTSQIVYMRMDYDSIDKFYRGGCHHLDNIWPLLPIHKMRQRVNSCNCCPSALEAMPKEVLITKLLVMAEKIHYNI